MATNKIETKEVEKDVSIVVFLDSSITDEGIDDVSDIIGYLLESDDKVNKRRLKMKIRS